MPAKETVVGHFAEALLVVPIEVTAYHPVAAPSDFEVEPFDWAAELVGPAELDPAAVALVDLVDLHVVDPVVHHFCFVAVVTAVKTVAAKINRVKYM